MIVMDNIVVSFFFPPDQTHKHISQIRFSLGVELETSHKFKWNNTDIDKSH